MLLHLMIGTGLGVLAYRAWLRYRLAADAKRQARDEEIARLGVLHGYKAGFAYGREVERKALASIAEEFRISPN